jgi:hypothetical protein
MWPASPVERSLVWVDRQGRDRVMVVALQTSAEFVAGKPRRLFEGPFEADIYPNYDISPDGNRFVMVRRESSPPREIHVVLNWFEELTHLVSVGLSRGLSVKTISHYRIPERLAGGKSQLAPVRLCSRRPRRYSSRAWCRYLEIWYLNIIQESLSI